jgi:LPS export ABC transporter protein LptC
VVPFFLLVSCINAMDDIREVSNQADGPSESQWNMNLTYTDSGKVMLVVQAPKADHFPLAKEPYTEFAEGIHARFMDKQGQEESSIRSNYAKRFTQAKQWEARGKVVVINRQGEQLETEHLLWSEEEQRIWSNEFVTLSKGSEVIMGQGFEADQNFTSYTIKKVTGSISLDDAEDVEGQ